MTATTTHQLEPDLTTDEGLRHAFIAYGPELRSFAAKRLGSGSNAEDVVQETLLRAWRSADRFDAERGSMRTWLYVIARNILIDLARARASRPATTPLTADVVAGDDVDALLDSLTLAAAMRQLSAEHRQVVYYCHLRQCPHQEVAQLLRVPVGTIRSRLFYAREALKDALEQLGAAFEGSRRSHAA